MHTGKYFLTIVETYKLLKCLQELKPLSYDTYIKNVCSRFLKREEIFI